MRRLIWGFAGRTFHIVGNLMSRLIFYKKNPVISFVGQYGYQQPPPMQYGYQQQPGYVQPQQNVVYVKDKKKGGGMLGSNTGKMAAGMYFLRPSLKIYLFAMLLPINFSLGSKVGLFF